MNREAWLNKAIEKMRPWFDVELPETIRISVGRAPGRLTKNSVGWTCPVEWSADGTSSIFIGPQRAEPVDILATVLHEMIHVSDNCESGHTGHFIKVARRMGFTAKWTSSENRDPELTQMLVELAEELGPYPHVPVNPGVKVKAPSKTYMIKLLCIHCDYTLRTTQKWIDTAIPVCPDEDCEGHDEPMEVEAK